MYSYTSRRIRQSLGLIVLAVSLIVAGLQLSGCSTEETGPVAQDITEAPTLPDPASLEFNFGFFEEKEAVAKSAAAGRANFANAYLRVVVLNVVTRLVVAPPVAVFSLALHTPPSPQEDGSWIWVYTHVAGTQETQVRLRGLPQGDRVHWELRVTADHFALPLDRELWFEGTTANNGQEGRWFFHDLEDPDHPLTGEIAWGDNEQGDFLEFISHEAESDGDYLRYADAGTLFTVNYYQQATGEDWFIRWLSDGSGSLRVQDYNDGLEACWDEEQRDVECP